MIDFAAPSVLVSCRGVTKVFHQGSVEVAALRGVDLEVCAGQLTLLVGPSGCGKTTLLSVVAGILDQTEGEIAVLGHDLHAMPNREKVLFRGRDIGFVFQHYNLLPALTARENAAVPLLIAGHPRREAFRRSGALLEGMGMAHRMHAFPPKLSGGEQQRVAISRALVHEPRLLVCDEPTSALDGRTGQHIMELLRRTALRPDRAVLIVTHDSRLFGFGDRIAYMEDGLVVRIEDHGPAKT